MAMTTMAEAWDTKLSRYERNRTVGGPGVNLMIGDSITEQLYGTNPYGGCNFFNVGFGGINAQNMATYLDRILVNTKVNIAVVMLGTNNALPGITSTHVEEFFTAYAGIVQKLESHGGLVIIAQILPIEPNKPLSHLRDQASVNMLGRALYYRLCVINGVFKRKWISASPFYDAVTKVGKVGSTADGVHPSTQYRSILINMISTSVAQEKARTGRGCQ